MLGGALEMVVIDVRLTDDRLPFDGRDKINLADNRPLHFVDTLH
jgi:hypothetical protein